PSAAHSTEKALPRLDTARGRVRPLVLVGVPRRNRRSGSRRSRVVDCPCSAGSGASTLRSSPPSVSPTFGPVLAHRPGTMNKLIAIALFAGACGGTIDNQSASADDEAWSAAGNPALFSSGLEYRLDVL